MGNVGWYIATIGVGVFASILSGIVLMYLRQIKDSLDERIAQQDDAIAAARREGEKAAAAVADLAKQFAACRLASTDKFVPTETWLREAGVTRERLDLLYGAVKELSGKFEIVEQMPKIAGQIARETVREVMQYVNRGSHE
jgi:hypothetical protein